MSAGLAHRWLKQMLRFSPYLALPAGPLWYPALRLSAG